MQYFLIDVDFYGILNYVLQHKIMNYDYVVIKIEWINNFILSLKNIF